MENVESFINKLGSSEVTDALGFSNHISNVLNHADEWTVGVDDRKIGQT